MYIAGCIEENRTNFLFRHAMGLDGPGLIAVAVTASLVVTLSVA